MSTTPPAAQGENFQPNSASVQVPAVGPPARADVCFTPGQAPLSDAKTHPEITKARDEEKTPSVVSITPANLPLKDESKIACGDSSGVTRGAPGLDSREIREELGKLTPTSVPAWDVTTESLTITVSADRHGHGAKHDRSALPSVKFLNHGLQTRETSTPMLEKPGRTETSTSTPEELDHRKRNQVGRKTVRLEDIEFVRKTVKLKDPKYASWKDFEVVSTYEGTATNQSHAGDSPFPDEGAVPLAVSSDFKFLAREPKPEDQDSSPNTVVEVLLWNGGTVLRELTHKHGKTMKLMMLSFSAGGDILVGSFKATRESASKKPMLVVWSVITGDVLKYLEPKADDYSIAVGSVSEDKAHIYCLEKDSKASFTIVLYSLVATADVQPKAGEGQQTQKSRNSDFNPVEDPFPGFNPFEPFVTGQDGSPFHHRIAHKSNSSAKKHAEEVCKHYKKLREGGTASQPSPPPLYGQFRIPKTAIETDKSNESDKSKVEEGVVVQVFQAHPHLGVVHDLEHELSSGPTRDFCPTDPQLRVVVPNQKTVVVWSSSGELLHMFKHERDVTCLDVSKDGSVVVVGLSGYEGGPHVGTRVGRSELVIYSLVTFALVHRFILSGEVKDVELYEKEETHDGKQVVSDRKLFMEFAEDDVKRTCIELDEKDELKEGVCPHMLNSDGVAFTSDRRFYFLAEPRGSSLCMGCVRHEGEQDQPLEFCLVPKPVSAAKKGDLAVLNFMAKKVEAKLPDAKESEVKVWCVAMSGWGTTIAVGLTWTPRSSPENDDEVRRHFVVVLSATRGSSILPETLMVVEVEQMPRAICIQQELVSVLADGAQQASFAEKESTLMTFDTYTGSEVNSSKIKVTGRTLGLAAGGQHRIAQRADKRIFVEVADTSEVIFEIQDRDLTYRGSDASGKLLLLKSKSGTPFIKDLNNMDHFGPSAETTGLWAKDNPNPAELQLTLARYKHGLSTWPVLFTEQWSEVFTKMLDICIAKRDYGPFKVLIESCPYFWAGTRYHHKKVNEPRTIKQRWPGTGYLQKKDEASTIKTDTVEPVIERRTFWKKALDNNDKVLVQMLLDGVLQMANDTPELVPVQAMEQVYAPLHCPRSQYGHVPHTLRQPAAVRGMLEQHAMPCWLPLLDSDKAERGEQVTDFVRECILENKMGDKVQAFLANLPLLAVPNETLYGEEIVTAPFEDGEVLKTAWRTRTAPLSATAWSFLVPRDSAVHHKEEEKDGALSEEKGERGYRYVSALPGLTRSDVIAAFTSDKASPALVDNETMRATIDALEETTGDKLYPGASIKWDWTLTPYVITLLAFCCLVYYTATKSEPFDDLMKKGPERFGVGAGVVAVIGHVLFLFFEIIEFITIERQYKKQSLVSAWNFMPVLGNSLGIATFFLVTGDGDKELIRAVAAFAMILLWFNLFNYLRAYRDGSALVAMLVHIMGDMLYFVGVVGVLILGFAGGFYALHGHLDPEELGLTNENTCIAEPDNNEFLELSDALARTFLMSILGDFDVDALRSPLDLQRGEGGGNLTNISFLFFFMLVLLISVVALNALIALMGSTYGRVEESSQAVTYKEILSITFDKLRFRYALRITDKKDFERNNRWTHVLSPSENGSMPEARGISSGNPITLLRREIKESQKTAQKQMDERLRTWKGEIEAKIEGLGNDVEDVVNVSDQLGGQVGNIVQSQAAIATTVTMVATEVGVDMSLVPDLQGGGGGGGGAVGGGVQKDKKDALSKKEYEMITKLFEYVKSLEDGFREQKDAFNDVKTRLDKQGLLAPSSSRSASSFDPSRQMKSAAHASRTRSDGDGGEGKQV